jgi:hypothetical protein
MSTERGTYDFVLRGLLTEEALDKAGRRKDARRGARQVA